MIQLFNERKNEILNTYRMNVIVPFSCGACPEPVEGREKGIQGMRALKLTSFA